MTEVAPLGDSADAVPSLDDHRERKHKQHRWTRHRDEAPAKFDPPPPARALEILSELARRADNETGHCYRTLDGLAEATGRSRRTAQRAIDELELNGLITVKRSGRRRIDFWLQPLPAQTTRWHIRDANVAHQKCQRDISEATPCRSCDDTLSPPLSDVTAPQTAKVTEPPSAPQGGKRASTADAQLSIFEGSAAGQGERASARPRISSRPVNAKAWALTAQVLAAYNEQTGRGRQLLTTAGQPSDGAKLIYGRVHQWPDLTLEDHQRIIASTLASRWWGSGEETINVIYGPRVFENNIDRRADTAPARGAKTSPSELLRKLQESEACTPPAVDGEVIDG